MYCVIVAKLQSLKCHCFFASPPQFTKRTCSLLFAAAALRRVQLRLRRLEAAAGGGAARAGAVPRLRLRLRGLGEEEARGGGRAAEAEGERGGDGEDADTPAAVAAATGVRGSVAVIVFARIPGQELVESIFYSLAR